MKFKILSISVNVPTTATPDEIQAFQNKGHDFIASLGLTGSIGFNSYEDDAGKPASEAKKDAPEKAADADTIPPAVNSLLQDIEADVAKIALPALQNIQGAFNAVVASNGDTAVVIEQEAVILSNINTIELEAPALIPVLQAQAIVSGSSLASTEIGNLIAYLNNLVTPAAPPATATTKSKK